ncbi:MAG: DUF4230 domain-containing protein [Chloroflexi bacterium]|nr:DUF4230 domain-containing protein [Chloroflexota bacterium]
MTAEEHPVGEPGEALKMVDTADSYSPGPPQPKKRSTFRFVGVVLLIIIIALIARRYLPETMGGATAPAPSPTLRPPVVTVRSLHPLAELATIQLPMVVDVSNERIPDDIRQNLGGHEQILMLVYGDVKAGFDLSRLQEEDLWSDGTRVQLHLPAPKILSSSIDFENSRVLSYERSFFVDNTPELQSETLAEAKALIEQGALEAGILDLASQFGKIYFENHLRSLGFEEIRIAIN